VAAPAVSVEPAQVRVDVAPTTVNVPAAEVRVDVAAAVPTIHVEPATAQVSVENRVESPTVNVTPEVTVHLPDRQTVTEIERDAAGVITRTVQTETTKD